MAGNHPSELSPRQRMINMMYLVLTALLALNVSKEVLNSFFEVNLGIVKTTESLDDKSNDTYTALEKFNNKIKSAPYIALTNQIKPEADNLILYIQEMKYDLVYAADGGEVYLEFYEDGNDDENRLFLKENIPFNDLDESDKKKKISYLNKKDSRDASGDLFNPEQIDGRAAILKNKINEYRLFLLEILNQSEISQLILPGASNPLIKEVNSSLEIKEGYEYGEKGNKRTWEYHNFYDMPAVGALTLLSKWQADIRNMEAEVVSFLANNVSSSDLKFTSATATSIPSSTFVISGDEFSAQIFLSAFDETANPEIYIGDYTVSADSTKWVSKNETPLKIVNGKGIYKIKTGGTGPKSYKGFIKVPQDNEDKFYAFEGEYTVAKPIAAVSPDYMLAMYRGTGNPITVSVPGYDSKNLTVRFDQGDIKGSKGKYIVTPSNGGKSKKGIVSVYGPNSKGKKVKLGNVEFTLYKIPPPKIYLAVDGDEVTPSEIINSKGLLYTKEGFLKLFDGIKYAISSYDVVRVSGSTGQSERADGVRTMKQGKARTVISDANSGDAITIDNIWYKVNGKKRKFDYSVTKDIK